MTEVMAKSGASGISERQQSNQYDDAVEDFWRDLDLQEPEPAATAAPSYDNPAKDMDEEIKVTKKRKPVAKLDDARLLSERGIPELRRRAAKRIKLRGKGHEFEDIGAILQMYHMWLDDMFPKAKFRDGLMMIEKLGHSKRLNVMRKAWITSTRPTVTREEAEQAEQDQALADDTPLESNQQAPVAEGHDQKDDSAQQPPDDELDALLAGSASPARQQQDDELGLLLSEKPAAAGKKAARKPFEEDDSDQDELDALLAQETKSGEASPAVAEDIVAQDIENRFADEEDVLNELGDW